MKEPCFKVIVFEDAAIADFATFAGGKYFYIPQTSVKIVSQGDTISGFEDAPIDFQTDISTGSPELSIERAVEI